jgi:uncharacterized protein (TIGR02246 family)
MALKLLHLKTVASGTAALLLATSTASAQQAGANRAADRQQIEAIISQWESAWNSHDMARFGALFHDDGVWVLWTGAVWTGRPAIQEGHAEAHKTIFQNSTQRELLEELTFVGPDAAVARFCSMLKGDERTPDKLVRSRKFLVLTRRGGTWRVGWGQNTRLADTVPDSECFVTLRRAHGGA